MMRVTSFAFPLTLALVLGSAGSARAQQRGRGAGSGGPFGVGVHAMLNSSVSVGPFGPAIVYDTGMFHIEGILGFDDDDTATTIDLGGRFWYHINSSQAADFSLGGGLGIRSNNPDGVGDSTTDIQLEGGGQIRVFLVPNVSLSASLGLVINTGDDPNGVSLNGDLAGSAGITYFF